MSILQAGRKLELEDGRVITVGSCIGRGGEGEVYKVTLNDTGEEKALKWYNSEVSLQVKRNKYSNFTQNINKGNPNKRFLWPQALVKWVKDESGQDNFGYIMDLLPSQYVSFNRVILGDENVSLDVLIEACINLVSSFKALHLRGYSYQDVQPKNFALDPESGDILIYDTDNIVGPGQIGGVLGVQGYMAPEIVRGDKNVPDASTDLYSLALIIFRLLIGYHPLDGKRTGSILNEEAKKRYFGSDPLFIFDKYDQSNANSDDYAERFWSIMPTFAKDVFQRAFDRENCLLSNRNRLLDSEWLNMLLKLKGSLVPCPYCKYYLFLDGKREVSCGDCHRTTKPSFILRVNGAACGALTLPVHKYVKLYKYLIIKTKNSYEVFMSIENDGANYYFRNNSDFPWLLKNKNIRIEPGARYMLQAGDIISFGHGRSAAVEDNVII